MNFKEVATNITVYANSFNPSIFSSHWLIKNDIFKEEEIDTENSFFNPKGCLITVSDNYLDVRKERLIYGKSTNAGDINVDPIIKIIRKLPETPFDALGMKFEFFIEDIENLNNRLFVNKNVSIIDYFEDGNPKYGIYFSKDYEETRLKFEALPVEAKTGEDEEFKDYVRFSFNFIHEYQRDDGFNKFVGIIACWKKFHDFSIEIMNKVKEQNL